MSVSSSSNAVLHGKRILIAEDETLIAMAIEAELEEAGVKIVGPFSTVEATVDALLSDRVDLAILDISLGSVDVYAAADLCVKLKIPFIFQSGLAISEEIAERFPHAPLLEKPYSFDLLLTMINDLI